MLFLQISYQNDPEAAMIQFENSQDARAAFCSPEAVFNNRFIKVYWGKIGKKVLSNRCSAKRNKTQSQFQREKPPDKPYHKMEMTPSTPAIEPPIKTISIGERERLTLESKDDFAELNEALLKQKNLMTKLEACTCKREKRDLMEMLRQYMFHSNELKKSLQQKQILIRNNQRSSKVNVSFRNSSKVSPSSSLSSHSMLQDIDMNIHISSDEEDEVKVSALYTNI